MWELIQELSPFSVSDAASMDSLTCEFIFSEMLANTVDAGWTGIEQ